MHTYSLSVERDVHILTYRWLNSFSISSCGFCVTKNPLRGTSICTSYLQKIHHHYHYLVGKSILPSNDIWALHNLINWILCKIWYNIPKLKCKAWSNTNCLVSVKQLLKVKQLKCVPNYKIMFFLVQIIQKLYWNSLLCLDTASKLSLVIILNVKMKWHFKELNWSHR